MGCCNNIVVNTLLGIIPSEDTPTIMRVWGATFQSEGSNSVDLVTPGYGLGHSIDNGTPINMAATLAGYFPQSGAQYYFAAYSIYITLEDGIDPPSDWTWIDNANPTPVPLEWVSHGTYDELICQQAVIVLSDINGFVPKTFVAAYSNGETQIAVAYSDPTIPALLDAYFKIALGSTVVTTVDINVNTVTITLTNIPKTTPVLASAMLSSDFMNPDQNDPFVETTCP